MKKKRYLLIIIILIAQNIYAQQQSQLTNRLLEMREKARAQQTLSQTFPLEEVIDPLEYIVGPGDIFTINIWGALDEEMQAMITPEGTLLVQKVGSIDVKDCTLQKARERISRIVK